MEIKINLNNLKYRYDVYQMFNIYFSLDEIKFNEERSDYYIHIDEENISFKYKDIEVHHKIKNSLKDELKIVIFEELAKITKDSYPWGTLVGIRPSKLALKLLQEGKSNQEIYDIFYEKHRASKEKAELCIEVAKNESNFVNKDSRNISI